MSIFVVDSNFFIQAHRMYYPLDIASSFWNKIKQLAQNGQIISIDKVKNELYDKNDALEYWCIENLPADFFKPTDDIVETYSQITNWCISKSHHYNQNAINEFLDADEADAFLVAYSLADVNNRCIVTYEVSDVNRKNKVKIPEPCNAFNVRFLNTMEMLRELGETF